MVRSSILGSRRDVVSIKLSRGKCNFPGQNTPRNRWCRLRNTCLAPKEDLWTCPGGVDLAGGYEAARAMVFGLKGWVTLPDIGCNVTGIVLKVTIVGVIVNVVSPVYGDFLTT